MKDTSAPYGGQLLEEIRRLRRLDLITGKLDFDAIQVLKQADREATLKLFRGSSYAFLQLIKTKEPAEVAQALVRANQDESGTASMAASLIAVIAAQ
jgi:hypothetical protein